MLAVQLVGFNRVVIKAFQRSLTQDENEGAIKRLLDALRRKGKVRFALDKVSDDMARLSTRFNQLPNGERAVSR